MRTIAIALILSTAFFTACSEVSNAQDSPTVHADKIERNKQIARQFYEDLWFSDNTDKYSEYIADEYVVHDVGDRKGVTENAVEQKNIADLFHSMGEMTGEIDYQIAEGDKVATRWFVSMKASKEAKTRGMTDVDRVAIVNIFRFNDAGEIVEVWNHRHDVELPQPPEYKDDGQSE